MLRRILVILKYCHERKVVHRDLKPCHVIFRNSNVEDPVLIDFGLAFNDDAEVDGFETETEQGVGNRFIVLPEQMGKGADKRDYRSDITQVVGLLFFMLTSEYPGLIADKKQKKPHERLDVFASISGLTPTQRNRVTRILDVGFEWQLDSRWQNIDDLIRQLNAVTNDANGESSFDDRLQLLQKKLAGNPRNALIDKISVLFDEFGTTMESIVRKASPSMAGILDLHMVNMTKDMNQYAFQCSFVIQNRRERAKQSVIQVDAKLEVNDQLLIKATPMKNFGGGVGGGLGGPAVAKISAIVVRTVSPLDPTASDTFTQVAENALLHGIEAIAD